MRFLVTCFFSYFNDYGVDPLLIIFVQNIYDAATNETAFESRGPRLLFEVEGVAENEILWTPNNLSSLLQSDMKNSYIQGRGLLNSSH